MQIEIRPLENGLISITPEESLANIIKDILEKDLGCEVSLFLERATGRAVDEPSQGSLQTVKYISYMEVSYQDSETSVQEIASDICKRLQGQLSHSGDNYYIDTI